jgi:hypothetical protein
MGHLAAIFPFSFLILRCLAGQRLESILNRHAEIDARTRGTMAYLNDLSNAWTDPLPQDIEGQQYIRDEKEPPNYRPRSEPLRRVTTDSTVTVGGFIRGMA